MEDKKKFRGFEWQGLEDLAGALTLVMHDELLSRYEKIPYGKRELGRVRSGLKALYKGVVEQMPLDQLKKWRVMMPRMRVTAGVSTVAPTLVEKQIGTFLSTAQTEILVRAAREHCLMCTCTTRDEARRCPLRDVLEELDIIGQGSEEFEHTNVCSYMTM